MTSQRLSWDYSVAGDGAGGGAQPNALMGLIWGAGWGGVGGSNALQGLDQEKTSQSRYLKRRQFNTGI